MKRTAVVAVVVIGALGAGLAIWARSVLTGDAVRRAIASQIGAALGQPVTIGGLGASVFPRVSMDLADVSIGQPARVTIRRLRVGASLGALISRRIEHAGVRLEGARIELPLAIAPAGAPADGPPAAGPPERAADEGGAPLTLVSVDEIVLSEVEVVSGGRTLRGDADLTWQAGQLAVERVSLAAGDAHIEITGLITDVDGPVGELKVTSPNLDVIHLVDFVSAFAAGVSTDANGAGRASQISATSPSRAMHLTVAIDAARATFGDLQIEGLIGKARVMPDAIRIDPIDFRLFGGTSAGSLAFALGGASGMTLTATIAGLDAAALMAFAGSPDTVTGRLSGRLDIEAEGAAASDLLRTARGTARLAVTDGSVRGLGLVRSIILASSMRADSQAQASSAPRDESFSRLGLSAELGGGVARTTDVQFESPDVLMHAAGVVNLTAASVDLNGDVQLSDELSKSAGRDLVRYTQDGGRVTLPVTVNGPVTDLRVRVDVTDAAARALKNRAAEEAKKALSKTLGRIIRRP